MNRLAVAFGLATLLCGAFGSCSFLQTQVTLTLNPSAVLTIQSQGTATTAATTSPITVSPASAGSSYTDNKTKIASAALDSITFEVAQVYPDNMATTLTDASVTLTDAVTGQSVTFALQAPVQKINVDGTSNSFSAFTPDPSPFIDSILKSGDSFTLSATASIDQAPVHIQLTVHIGTKLTVNLI